MTIGPQGTIIEGEWNITAAIGLHLQLHALRPEINVVIQPPWLKTAIAIRQIRLSY